VNAKLRYSALANRVNTHLPEQHWPAHQLSFVVHDVMTQLLVSGRRASVFKITIPFRDEMDRLSFERAEDVFAWLERTRRTDERADLLVTLVFPAVFRDMLHCIYEALEASRKAKLNVTFMVIRKPLQESLFLLESLVVDRHDFAQRLSSAPITLWSQGAGGLEVHTKRIAQVLQILGEAGRFDAGYIAQLRYDKATPDGFDGICNQAMHLFTRHKAIATEPMNLNFIFSGMDSTLTQLAYFYSRLPYLIAYMHRLVEHICAGITPSPRAYLHDMDRRISSLVLLWWDTVESNYAEPRLRKFVLSTRDWLFQNCNEAGYRTPNRIDLTKMGCAGAYPGESQRNIAERNRQFERDAIASGALAPQSAIGSVQALMRSVRSRLRARIGSFH